MSTPILTEQTHDPIAWTGADFTGPDDFVYRLSAATVAGLEELLARTRNMPRDEIRREHVGHPDVDGPAREVYEEVVRGRGLVVVRGFPVATHTVESAGHGPISGNLSGVAARNPVQARITEEFASDGK